MAQLPDVDPGSVTQMEVPVSNRPIVGYDPSKAYEGIEDVGKQVGAFGQQLKTKQDNIEYSFARSNYMSAMVKSAKDEENNPDWKGSDARWKDASQQALQQAQGQISNPMNREKLSADAADMTWRIYSGVLQNSDTKRRQEGLANGLQADQNDQETYASTNDPVVRQNIIQTRTQRWNDLVDHGFVNPVQRFHEDKRFLTDAATNWVDNQAPEDKLKILQGSLPESITGVKNDQKPVSDAIGDAAKKNNVNPDTLSRIAMIESGGRSGVSNPAPGSTSSGLFGFTATTGKKYGVTPASTDEEQADGAARLLKDNTADLQTKIGRDPTPDEQYLAHQQGPAGAAALLKNPGMKAVDAIRPFYKNATDASKAITQNGGSDDMTSAQFTQHWKDKFNGADTSSLNTPAAFPRTGTPVDYLDPQKRVQLYNQLKSEFKQNDAEAGSAVKSGAALVSSGMPLSDDQAKDIGDKSSGAFNLATRTAGQNLLAQNDTLKKVISMSPEDAEGWRANLQQMQTKGVLPPEEMGNLNFLNKFIPTMQQQIKTNPVGFFERSHGEMQIDPNDANSLAQANQRAQTISSLYGTSYSQSVASKSSQSSIVTAYQNADLPGKEKIIKNWGDGFGTNAVAAAQIFKNDAPEFPYAVGLAHETGDVKTALDIIRGSERIKEDKNKVIPLNKIDDQLNESGYGEALPPMQFDQLRTASRSLFAARYNTGKDVTPEVLDGVIQNAMGPTQLTTFGSQAPGKKIVTPPGVSSSQMDKFLGSLDNSDITTGMANAKMARGGEGPEKAELPRFKGGVTFDMSRTPFYLQTVAPGTYHVMQPNGQPYPAADMPDGIMAVKFDANSISRPHAVKANPQDGGPKFTPYSKADW